METPMPMHYPASAHSDTITYLINNPRIHVHYYKSPLVDDPQDIYLYDCLSSGLMLCRGQMELRGYNTNNPKWVTCQACNEWLHA